MQQVLRPLLQAELDCADIHDAVSTGHVCCLQFFTSRYDAILADFKQQTPFHLIDHRTAPVCHELTSTLLAALSSEAATTLVNTADARGNTAPHGTAGCKLADDGTVINDCYDDNLIVCHTCIRALLAVGADPTIKNKAGVQAVSIPEVLSVARRDEDLDILDEYLVTVKALQQAGLDINVTHYKGQTEYHLHSAAGHGYRYQCESTVRLLLDCGADVLLHDSDDWTAMQRAAYWESERGIDSEKEGNDEIIQMLYDTGGHDQLFGTLSDGQTLLHLASIWPDSMQKLCELGALVNARSDDMQTPLHSASASGNSDTIRVLLDSGANVHAYGDSKTDVQAYGGSKSTYEAGATIDAKTTAGCTAAWLVARYSSAQGMYCPEEYNIYSVAQQLEQVLSRGADLMHYSDQHGSLLHAAAGNGDVDGCSVTDADTDGNTALRLCLQAHKDSAACFTLLSKGVEVKPLDSEGRSALQLACLYCDCDTVHLLFDSGGWIETLAAACMLNVVIAGNTDTLALLLERGINCSSVIDDGRGYTLLHAAAAYGRLECAGMLIRHGCEATTLSTDGVSAVDIAFALDIPALFRRDDLKIEPWESCKATALLLLQNRCDYDVNKKASDNAVYATLITEYLDELRERTTRQQQILQAYTTSASSIKSANTNEYDNSSQSDDDNTTLLAKLHKVTTRQSSRILLNMLVPSYGWGISNVNSSSADIKLISYDDDDFTQEGFASIIEYLYTGAVVGVTYGILDCDKLQTTLQAAQYFNLPILDTAARSWAQTSGVTVAT
eukprot:730-Heterococcus_DN1.PRE.2